MAEEAMEEETGRERLEEILRQTEKYARWVAVGRNDTEQVEKTSSSSKAEAREATGRFGARRKTEDEEDKEILEDEGKAPTTTQLRFTEQPPCIQNQENPEHRMRPYQIEALNWMIRLHDSNINGILADEMGLGKTLETISLLAYVKHYRDTNLPHLIIVPKSTSSNWQREVKRWAPALTVSIFHGNKEERVAQRETLKSGSVPDVLITTYEIAIIERSVLESISFDYIIIDEAHRIKNEQSKLSKQVRKFKVKHRLLITGTPLQNNLHELWALLNFLLPDMFKSAEAFSDWFDLTKDEERTTMVSKLHRILRPFLLRRLKNDVEKALLPKVETNLYIGFSAMQREWYTNLLAKDMEALNLKVDKGKKNSAKGSKMRLLNIVMQLRKCCNHPYLFQGAEPGPPYFEGEHLVENSGKMVLLDKLLKKLKSSGNRVLIFSQMTRLLDILEDYCNMRGFEYCRLDGSTNQELRDSQMDAYNAKDSTKFIFLLSTRAGGLGINLQTADTVILYDSDWNPQMDLQAMDRAHRIGQKKQVNVYRLITENSVEEKIVERATRKLALDAMVIRQGRLAENNRQLNATELQSMIRFGAKYVFELKGKTITDEDIEQIFSKGKTKTAEIQKKVQENQLSLANFSLADEGNVQSVYEFEGKNWAEKNESTKSNPLQAFIAPPKRQRKENYNEDKYYKDAMRQNEPRKGPRKFVTKEYKPKHHPDFQFLKMERINQLEKKKWDAQFRYKQLKEEKRVADKLAREEAKRAKKLAAEQKRIQERIEASKRREQLLEEKERENWLAIVEARQAKRQEEEESGDEGENEQVLEDNGRDQLAGPVSSSAADEASTDNVPAVKMEIDTPSSSSSSSSLSSSSASLSKLAQRSPSKAATRKALAVKEEAELQAALKESKAEAHKLGRTSVKTEHHLMTERRRSSRSRVEAKPLNITSFTAGDKMYDTEFQDGNDNEDDQTKNNEERGHKMRGGGRRSGNSTPSKVKKVPLTEAEKEDARLWKEAGKLTRAEEKELERLWAMGFPRWTRRHFTMFLDTQKRYGKKDTERFPHEVEGIEPEEVERYHRVFWKRYKELKGQEKFMRAIMNAEQQRAKVIRLDIMTKKFVAKFEDPLEDIELDYPIVSRTFSPEEDRIIIVGLAEAGYGKWLQIQKTIRTHPDFRFDWFLRSRNEVEVEKRCEYLLKLIEKGSKKRGRKKGTKKGAKRGGSKRKEPAKRGSAGKGKRGGRGKKRAKTSR